MADEERKTELMQNAGLPALTPEQLAQMAKDSGKQKFNVRELMIPVLKISNTTSGVMKRSDKEYRPEAKEGQLYDTLTFKFYDPPVKLLIVRFETNYIESLPRMGRVVRQWGSDRAGYERATGGNVGTRVTADGNEIRELARYYTILVRDDATLLPCLMYMGSTGWREARKLNTLIASMEFLGPNGPYVAPPYGQIIKASTVPATDGKNTWMAWSFERAGLTLAQPGGQHLYDRAHELEEAIDANLTRMVGTADDERVTEGQAHNSGKTIEVGGGPPQDAPPPAGEEDYGNDANARIVAKAKDAPF